MLGVNDLQHLPNVESLKAIKKIVLLFSALSKHPSKVTLDFRHYKVMSDVALATFVFLINGIDCRFEYSFYYLTCIT
jgi:hypothetical protein